MSLHSLTQYFPDMGKYLNTDEPCHVPTKITEEYKKKHPEYKTKKLEKKILEKKDAILGKFCEKTEYATEGKLSAVVDRLYENLGKNRVSKKTQRLYEAFKAVQERAKSNSNPEPKPSFIFLSRPNDSEPSKNDPVEGILAGAAPRGRGRADSSPPWPGSNVPGKQVATIRAEQKGCDRFPG